MLWLESVVYVPVIVESTVSDLELQRPGFLIACYREVGGRLIEVPFLFLFRALAVDLTLYRPEVDTRVFQQCCYVAVVDSSPIQQQSTKYEVHWREMLLHGCFFAIFFQSLSSYYTSVSHKLSRCIQDFSILPLFRALE